MCSKKAPDSCISHSNDLDSLSYPMLTFSMNSFWLFVFRQKNLYTSKDAYVPILCSNVQCNISLSTAPSRGLTKFQRKAFIIENSTERAASWWWWRFSANSVCATAWCRHQKSAWTWPALAVVVLGRQAGSSHPKISYGRSSIQIFRT